MKLFILVSSLMFTGIQAYAQLDHEKELYIKKSEKFRKMKNTGRSLTIGGSILFIAGIVTLANSTTTTTIYNGGVAQTSTTGNPAAGAIAYVFGSVGIGAGIPLWIIGKNNEQKYNRKLEEITIGLTANPGATGLTLTYKF